jgi:hypothetical protein
MIYEGSLMNEGRDEKFTVAQFSKILELKKVGDLEKYFINIEEPELEFLEIFSQTFAINYEWLTEGKDIRLSAINKFI